MFFFKSSYQIPFILPKVKFIKFNEIFGCFKVVQKKNIKYGKPHVNQDYLLKQ